MAKSVMLLPTPSPTDAIADLTAVNFGRLVSHDDNEIMRLQTACQKDGFFYLDLDDPQSEEYLELISDVFEDARHYFAQPLKMKMKDDKTGTPVANICGFVLFQPPAMMRRSDPFDQLQASGHGNWCC